MPTSTRFSETDAVPIEQADAAASANSNFPLRNPPPQGEGSRLRQASSPTHRLHPQSDRCNSKPRQFAECIQHGGVRTISAPRHVGEIVRQGRLAAVAVFAEHAKLLKFAECNGIKAGDLILIKLKGQHSPGEEIGHGCLLHALRRGLRRCRGEGLMAIRRRGASLDLHR